MTMTKKIGTTKTAKVTRATKTMGKTVGAKVAKTPAKAVKAPAKAVAKAKPAPKAATKSKAPAKAVKSPKKPKIAKSDISMTIQPYGDFIEDTDMVMDTQEVELSEEEFEAAMAESHEPGLDLDEEVEVLDNDEEFVD